MEKQRIWEEEFLGKICDKIRRVTPELKDLCPFKTRNGVYGGPTSAPYSWTCGFWGGIMWWMYRLTGENMFLEKAKAASARMDGGLVVFTPLGHDVGFQYLLTTVADYVQTGEERARVASIHAATLLAGRFNVKGEFIRAWNDTASTAAVSDSKVGVSIIDCMMNIPLLFWASEESGDPRYRHIAVKHADTVLREFMREDGSVNHIVVFDAETGAVVEKPRGQGYAPGSSWARGQGWALYGFAMAYSYTGKKEYLEASLKSAKYFMDNLPDDGVPPCDFAQPATPAYLDTSAGVIAACGMIELKKFVSGEKADVLEEGIRKLLEGAYSRCDFTANNQAVLHDCRNSYHGTEDEGTAIYGDFYLIEALMKRRGDDYLFRKCLK